MCLLESCHWCDLISSLFIGAPGDDAFFAYVEGALRKVGSGKCAYLFCGKIVAVGARSATVLLNERMDASVEECAV